MARAVLASGDGKIKRRAVAACRCCAVAGGRENIRSMMGRIEKHNGVSGSVALNVAHQAIESVA